MPIPLLETKLFAPRPRAGLVSRPRLAALLDHGVQSKLTLIAAPPGFGKTTLLATWLAEVAPQRTTAWLSLDPADNDPAAFWAYVVAALDAAAPGVGATAGPLLEQPQSLGPAALTPLLNALNENSSEIVLVLDDYHVVDRREIHDGVEVLLDHLPPNLHVVIATRADPPLPLARLRARGELVEIRAADLRFTGDEASAYLNEAMGLSLTSGDVAALEGRTEGWIAALQLAALSMSGRSDPGAFIADFTGDDRYIVDYLVEEVLDRQSPQLRAFLLRTSILGRFTGSLSDAVAEVEDGKVILEQLDRANLFLVPLDDRRSWYRYHHLFADMLQTRLMVERPAEIPGLHRRASAWFEQEGDRAEAVEHAIAAGDVDRAADLIELAAHDLQASRQEQTLGRWLDALPDAVFDTRPGLAITHVGALLQTGDTNRVQERLAAAERWIGAAHGEPEQAAAIEAGMTGRHPQAVAHLASAIPLYRAALARMAGDVAATIVNAEAALALAGPDQPLERGGAAGMLGLALWTRGDLEASYDAWDQSATSLEAAGHMADILGVSIAMAEIRRTQGRLDDARQIFDRGLRIGTQSEAMPLRGTADMHVGLSEIARERGDLAAARLSLDVADGLGEGKGLPQNPYRLRVARARVALADGDLEAAVRLLDEAEQRYNGDFFPDVRPIAAIRARVRITQGRLAEARVWARDAQISPDDELTYLREYEHATLARLLLAEGGVNPDLIEAAIRLGERLLSSAVGGGRRGSAIDILVVLALARHARRDLAGAAEALDQAATLAEPDGWTRIFLDEGPPMTSLMAARANREGSPRYLAHLRAATRPAGDSVRQAAMFEPLSEREVDVLHLLRSDLDGPEIARELNVSLNTFRTHTKNVYAKLDVSSRRAAVRRAEELGLF